MRRAPEQADVSLKIISDKSNKPAYHLGLRRFRWRFCEWINVISKWTADKSNKPAYHSGLRRFRWRFCEWINVISICTRVFLYPLGVLVILIYQVNTCRPRQNGWHFTDLNCIFLNGNHWIFTGISSINLPWYLRNWSSNLAMEIFFTLLALCEWNPPVKRSVTSNFRNHSGYGLSQ